MLAALGAAALARQWRLEGRCSPRWGRPRWPASGVWTGQWHQLRQPWREPIPSSLLWRPATDLVTVVLSNYGENVPETIRRKIRDILAED